MMVRISALERKITEVSAHTRVARNETGSLGALLLSLWRHRNPANGPKTQRGHSTTSSRRQQENTVNEPKTQPAPTLTPKLRLTNPGRSFDLTPASRLGERTEKS